MFQEDIFYKGGEHAVLLLPGLSSTPLEMRPVAKALQRDGYTVSVPHIAGYGLGSPCTDWRAWIEAARAKFRALRETHETVSICGLSMGATLSLAVNVSPRQFHQTGFVAQVLAALAGAGADGHQLKLEMTEGLLLQDVEDTIDKMGQLRGYGVGFSLDDFGTGYSSLSYLKRLPLDQLKIDQSFVRDVLTDPNDATIACTIVTLARSLGLDVVAEGVETEGQRAFLLRNGCRQFQGYLFGRPGPAELL